jgi:hypothetical protein
LETAEKVTGWFYVGGIFATYLSKIFSARCFDRDKTVPGRYPLKNQINWRLVLNGFYYGPSGFLKGDKRWELFLKMKGCIMRGIVSDRPVRLTVSSCR